MSMSRFFIVYWLVLGEPIYNIIRFVLQGSGEFYLEGVWLGRIKWGSITGGWSYWI